MASLDARDLMTADVLTVPPDTPVMAMARLLADRGISAVPVVDAAGKVLGVVTEADLIRRLAGQADKPAGWLAGLFASQERDAERYARTHGVTARDLMTTELVAVDPDKPASAVAHLMEDRGVRRVLVIQDGRLRGIVSRADLLRALVSPPPAPSDRSDAQLRGAVIAAMRREPWANTYFTMVEVHDGVVEFHGFGRSDTVQRGLHVLAENVPGVKSVVDHTTPMPDHLLAGY